MLKSNLRSKTLKSFTQRPKIRNQNLKIDPSGYLPVARQKAHRISSTFEGLLQSHQGAPEVEDTGSDMWLVGEEATSLSDPWK